MMMFIAALLAVPAGTVTAGGVEVSADTMLEALQEKDIVFIGESHEDPLAHQWELYIWDRLAYGDRVLALEMFEFDVQEILDSYLAGGMTREEFLGSSRPWSNYETDYEPLVELARERGIPVIAANVPRSFAAMVASGGWQAISDQEFFQALPVDSSSGLYREKFMATMEAMGDRMHGMPMDHDDLYRAQLLKDAVMAASVEGLRCLFVCGSFHCDHHSGIPDQLPAGTAFVTVKILPEGEELDPEAADFIIVR